MSETLRKHSIFHVCVAIDQNLFGEQNVYSNGENLVFQVFVTRLVNFCKPKCNYTSIVCYLDDRRNVS